LAYFNPTVSEEEKKQFYKTDKLLGQIDENIQMEMREKVLAKNTDHSWFHQWIVYTIKKCCLSLVRVSFTLANFAATNARESGSGKLLA
jgi:hypothetical protein